MLPTWKLSNGAMSFEEGKNLYVASYLLKTYLALTTHASAKMNEKYSTMAPFDITSKMLGPYLFSHTAREALGEKMEYYFQDHAFMQPFIQARTSIFSSSSQLTSYSFFTGGLPQNSAHQTETSGRTREDAERARVDG
jgi:hypothetical protein